MQTALDPEALLDALQAHEQAQGRRRELRWGARTLDLDILLYGGPGNRYAAAPGAPPRHAAAQLRVVSTGRYLPANFVLPDGADLDTLVANAPRGTW